MPTEAYYLSENDLKILKEVVSKVGHLTTRPQAGDVADQIPKAPDVYVARTPAGGIPAISEEPGSGSFDHNDEPGSADCRVYQVVDDSGDWMLERAGAGNYEKAVFNLSGTAIPGDSWVLAVKDKFGKWWAIPTAVGAAGGGSDELLYEITAVPTTTANGHTGKRKTLNTPTNKSIIDYSPTSTITQNIYNTAGTDWPVGQLVAVNPIPDKSGKYWGYAVENASATRVGFVSLTDQTMGNGDKTFQDWVVVNSTFKSGGLADGSYQAFTAYSGSYGAGTSVDSVTALAVEDLQDSFSFPTLARRVRVFKEGWDEKLNTTDLGGTLYVGGAVNCMAVNSYTHSGDNPPTDGGVRSGFLVYNPAWDDDTGTDERGAYTYFHPQPLLERSLYLDGWEAIFAEHKLVTSDTTNGPFSVRFFENFVTVNTGTATARLYKHHTTADTLANVRVSARTGFAVWDDKTPGEPMRNGVSGTVSGATFTGGILTDLGTFDLTEYIQDVVAAMLVAGTNINLTYNDGAGTLTIDCEGGGGGSDIE